MKDSRKRRSEVTQRDSKNLEGIGKSERNRRTVNHSPDLPSDPTPVIPPPGPPRPLTNLQIHLESCLPFRPRYYSRSVPAAAPLYPSPFPPSADSSLPGASTSSKNGSPPPSYTAPRFSSPPFVLPKLHLSHRRTPVTPHPVPQSVVICQALQYRAYTFWGQRDGNGIDAGG